MLIFFTFVESMTLNIASLTRVSLSLQKGKYVYFASDFHLGAPDRERSREREHKLISWIRHNEHQMQEIWLLGDVFDFWFEYGHAVPGGSIRFQGELARLADQGIPVRIFAGNHDLWYKDYFQKEFGAQIYHEPVILRINDTYDTLVGHGDGLGPGDAGYKRLKKIFTNKFCRWAFARIHPNAGIALARKWSAHSRSHNPEGDQQFKGEGEWLWQFAKEVEASRHFDYYLFGHRHLPLDLPVGSSSRYINTGEWLTKNSFAYANHEGIHLDYWV